MLANCPCIAASSYAIPRSCPTARRSKVRFLPRKNWRGISYPGQKCSMSIFAEASIAAMQRVRNGTIDDTNRKETNLDQRVLRQYTGAELDWLVEPARQPRERIHKPRLLGRRGPDRGARLV